MLWYSVSSTPVSRQRHLVENKNANSFWIILSIVVKLVLIDSLDHENMNTNSRPNFLYAISIFFLKKKLLFQTPNVTYWSKVIGNNVMWRVIVFIGFQLFCLK